MKKTRILVFVLFSLIVSSCCYKQYPSYVGTYIFNNSNIGLTRANTITGSVEVLQENGWKEVNQTPSRKMMNEEKF